MGGETRQHRLEVLAVAPADSSAGEVHHRQSHVTFTGWRPRPTTRPERYTSTSVSPFFSNHHLTVATDWGWSCAGASMSNVSRTAHSRICSSPSGSTPL